MQLLCTCCKRPIPDDAPSLGVQTDEWDFPIGELVNCQCGSTQVRLIKSCDRCGRSLTGQTDCVACMNDAHREIWG